MNILLIEDDKNINYAVSQYLKKDNYNVISCLTAENGLKEFQKNNIELIITDLNLPGMSGEMFCQYIRGESDVPIIMLTAKTGIDHTIRGLSLGADDYIEKPFSPKELILRVNNILKRTKNVSSQYLYKDNFITIYNGNNIIDKNNKKIELTNIEYKILKFLIKNKNIILSREEIINNIYAYKLDTIDRVVDAHIKSIRKKINDDVKNPKYIKTIYGYGYKFIGVDND